LVVGVAAGGAGFLGRVVYVVVRGGKVRITRHPDGGVHVEGR